MGSQLPICQNDYQSYPYISSSLSFTSSLLIFISSNTPSTNPPFVHQCKHSIASTDSTDNRFRRSVIDNLHLMLNRSKCLHYPLKTLSGSTDVAGIHKKSYAILASIGYSASCAFHHCRISKSLNACAV